MADGGEGPRYAIREAVAADAPWLARVILMASRSHLDRGAFDLMLPGSDDDRLAMLRRMVEHPVKCHCHYGGFLVAELDGMPVGALSGYEPLVKTPKRMERAVIDALTAAGLGPEDLEACVETLAPFERCKPEIPDDAWVVEWVAVEPAHRGRGVLDPLLEAILNEGRRRGYQKAQLALMLGNDRAERAYERHGFRVIAAKTDPAMERAVGTAGIARMAVAL